jgi:hypothetical protein
MDTVNMWCPMVQNLHVPAEQACRARGDVMWWYICCSPREAPVGEHIDHPGTDMRVWAWQNWGEKITGSLVWVADWWTGKANYPDPGHPQDPYLDLMSWGKSYPEDVYRTLFSYTHDPGPMETHRLKLAREIERLLEQKRR